MKTDIAGFVVCHVQSFFELHCPLPYSKKEYDCDSFVYPTLLNFELFESDMLPVSHDKKVVI